MNTICSLIIKMDLYDALEDKSLRKSFVLVVAVFIVSSIGLTVGLFVRDFILELFRRCRVYDSEKGFKEMGLRWLFAIPIILVVVCALVIIYLYKLERRIR